MSSFHILRNLSKLNRIQPLYHVGKVPEFLFISEQLLDLIYWNYYCSFKRDFSLSLGYHLCRIRRRFSASDGYINKLIDKSIDFVKKVIISSLGELMFYWACYLIFKLVYFVTTNGIYNLSLKKKKINCW